MARLMLTPIGGDLPESTVAQPAVLEREAELVARRAALKLGWGESYQQRVRAKGKLTAWERVERLAE